MLRGINNKAIEPKETDKAVINDFFWESSTKCF